MSSRTRLRVGVLAGVLAGVLVLLGGCLAPSPRAVLSCAGANCTVAFTAPDDVPAQPYSVQLHATGGVVAGPAGLECWASPDVPAMSCFVERVEPGASVLLEFVAVGRATCDVRPVVSVTRLFVCSTKPAPLGS